MYMLLFAAMIILILWLCQVAFIEDIYKAVKMSEIEDAAERITESINSSDPGTEIDNIGEQRICVTVIDTSYPTALYPLYTHHSINSCVIHSIDIESINILYDHTKNNGGECVQRFMYDERRRKYIGIEGDFFDRSQLDEYENRFPESIIHSSVITDDKGRELLILLNCEISPLDATVGTLDKILKVITFVIIGFALILSAVISVRVTKPIVRLTAEARKLGREGHNVRFKEDSFREVQDLSHALEYAKNELIRTDNLRRELIANISHDLRTPLTMIGGYSEMMRDIPGENNPENAQIIIDETQRLSSLVNDVLDISKLEAGTGNMHIECFNLTDSIKRTLERFSKLCEKNGYNIEFLMDGEAFVISDEKRITQVIYNLIINAMTHTGDDKTVKVRQFILENSVRIEVEDSGEGIEPELLPLIWDRYYKVDRVHKRSDMGSGLGLSIVKTIMEQTGGRYGVTSTVGKGSIFFIELEKTDI